METVKNDEKNIVLQLKRQLGRMMVQVDYMYRNDREISRLDLDVMMEHTREIYDLLCDYQAERVSADVIEKADDDDNQSVEINEGGEFINRDIELEIDDVKSEDDADENTADIYKSDDVHSEEDVHKDEDVNENEDINKDEDVNKDIDDDFDDEDWEDDEDETFHVEPVIDPIDVDDYEDSPMLIQPKAEPEIKPEIEDNSLAARLQHTHINDIKAALGINDKMMLINELFGGSFERYNKSIEALNEFPTLSGAKVYMGEMQIELQWDVESQAYKMLNDLVERRFV